MKKYSAADKKKYSFDNYKPNKNAKKVTYNGVEYLSKIQCMVLNNLDKRDLEEYLNPTLKKNTEEKTTPKEVVTEKVELVDETPMEGVLIAPTVTTNTDSIAPLDFNVL